MSKPHRKRNHPGKQGSIHVGFERRCTNWEKSGLQNLFYPREVDFGIFGIGMVAVNGDREHGQCEERDSNFRLGNDFQRMSWFD